MVPKRARIQGSQTFVSLHSRLEGEKEDAAHHHPHHLLSVQDSDRRLSAAGREARRPHESIRADRFTSQSLEYCPENTPKVSNRSRNSPLGGRLRDQTNGNYYTQLQMSNVIYSVRIGRIVCGWRAQREGRKFESQTRL